jgi:hypothetical protein
MMFKVKAEAVVYAKKQRAEGKKVKVKKVSFSALARAEVWFVE